LWRFELPVADRTELAASSFTKWRAIVWHLCVVAAGVVLLIEAANSFKPYGRFNNPLGSRIQGVLFLIWGLGPNTKWGSRHISFFAEDHSAILSLLLKTDWYDATLASGYGW